MKSLTLLFLAVMAGFFACSSFAAVPDASNQSNGQMTMPSTSNATTINDDMQKMTEVIDRMQSMKLQKMGRKMVMMGVQMKMMGAMLSTSGDKMTQSQGRQLMQLGEQVFSAGIKLNPMSINMNETDSMCKKMMDMNQ